MEGDKDMEKVGCEKDALNLKKFGENNIKTKSLVLEIDFLCKIEKVLSQYNELAQ